MTLKVSTAAKIAIRCSTCFLATAGLLVLWVSNYFRVEFRLLTLNLTVKVISVQCVCGYPRMHEHVHVSGQFKSLLNCHKSRSRSVNFLCVFSACYCVYPHTIGRLQAIMSKAWPFDRPVVIPSFFRPTSSTRENTWWVRDDIGYPWIPVSVSLTILRQLVWRRVGYRATK